MIQKAKSLGISKDELNARMDILYEAENGMDNILEVSGVNKRYGDFALKGITFYLPDGCITGFVGINGAGKPLRSEAS